MSRGKYTQKRNRRAFQSRVKAVIMKTAETKYVMAAGENSLLYHDRGEVSAGLLTTNQGAIIWNPWFAITRGDTVSNREGDQIYPRGMAIRLLYSNDGQRPSQFVRIIVAVIPKIVSGVITNGSNYDLLDAAGSNDTVTGMIKKEGVTVLYDKTFTVQAPAIRANPTTGDGRLFKKLFIKSKRGSKLSWQQDGTLSNKPLGVWVVPYDQFSSLRSDIIGNCSYTYKLYFKDV